MLRSALQTALYRLFLNRFNAVFCLGNRTNSVFLHHCFSISHFCTSTQITFYQTANPGHYQASIRIENLRSAFQIGLNLIWSPSLIYLNSELISTHFSGFNQLWLILSTDKPQSNRKLHNSGPFELGINWNLKSQSVIEYRIATRFEEEFWQRRKITHEDFSIEKKQSALRKVEVRRPGLEPGFRRWQRLVITTTLSAQMCFKV